MTIVAEAIDLTRHYVMGPVVVKALRGVNLQFHEGGYYAIMGQSGSGKSTLLNLLGCLDRPTTGAYKIGGQDVAQMSDDDLSEIRGRRIGFIFQSFNLITQLSVLENIEVPMFYQGVPPYESRERAQALAERVGLGDRVHHRPTELSGGQQQRVAVARALSIDPFIILADEPTGNLDSNTAREILGLLDELHQDGKTIIMVTHDESIAQRATTVIRMKDGLVDSVTHSEKESIAT